MAVMTYSAVEIIDRAIAVEKKAMHFYRETADQIADEHMRSVFQMLAGMEEDHVTTFSNMREQLSGNETAIEEQDPGAEMHFYLRMFEEMQAWEAHPVTVSGEEESKTADIVRAALQAEKETIIFYTFLYDFVTGDRGRDKVMDVIREERGHVMILRNIVDKLETLESKTGSS